MQSRLKIILLTIIILLSAGLVKANIVQTYPIGEIQIQGYNERINLITNINGREDADLYATFQINIDSNNLSERIINISINPTEMRYMNLIGEIEMHICEDMSYFNDFNFNESECKKADFSYSGTKGELASKDYIYSLRIPKSNSVLNYGGYIHYKIRDFTDKKGNYHIINSNLRCSSCEGQIRREIILPSKTFYFEKFPDDSKLDSYLDDKNETIPFIILKGTELRTIYFSDVEEQEKARNLRDWSIIMITIGISMVLSWFQSLEEKSRSKKITCYLMIIEGLLISSAGVFLLFDHIVSGKFLIAFFFIWALVCIYFYIKDLSSE